MEYLAQADGVVVGLGSCVEVDGLFDLILTLILTSQVVRRRPVPRLIGYLGRLSNTEPWLRRYQTTHANKPIFFTSSQPQFFL